MRIFLSPIAFARETFSASVKPSAGDAAEFQLSFYIYVVSDATH
jgi:hypothetical protein